MPASETRFEIDRPIATTPDTKSFQSPLFLWFIARLVLQQGERFSSALIKRLIVFIDRENGIFIKNKKNVEIIIIRLDFSNRLDVRVKRRRRKIALASSTDFVYRRGTERSSSESVRGPFVIKN